MHTTDGSTGDCSADNNSLLRPAGKIIHETDEASRRQSRCAFLDIVEIPPYCRICHIVSFDWLKGLLRPILLVQNATVTEENWNFIKQKQGRWPELVDSDLLLCVGEKKNRDRKERSKMMSRREEGMCICTDNKHVKMWLP